MSNQSTDQKDGDSVANQSADQENGDSVANQSTDQKNGDSIVPAMFAAARYTLEVPDASQPYFLWATQHFPQAKLGPLCRVWNAAIEDGSCVSREESPLGPKFTNWARAELDRCNDPLN